LSSAKHDKYQDDLYTTLLPFDICTQMAKIIKTEHPNDSHLEEGDTSDLKGIECFTFGYNVHWPLSIVLNQITISKYQLIFRQLFYCKHVENYLCRVWIANKNAKKFDHSTSELYRSAFTLRQRMMNAIQNLEYYMMIEVIEPIWHHFMQQLAKAKNIDDILSYHEDFLDHCLKNCMLTYPDLLKRIINVCNSCIAFCQFIEVRAHFPLNLIIVVVLV
jgi:gamma-tubulin complex component 2